MIVAMSPSVTVYVAWPKDTDSELGMVPPPPVLSAWRGCGVVDGQLGGRLSACADGGGKLAECQVDGLVAPVGVGCWSRL